ncbi:hypothetical protein AAFF_G00154290 [Aldrovandia affinis]|uniref:Uncharacterized protein n=1 Tax=Aldrovandia affinis TaxID=143900 RepID=A0AAD7WW56_9TELE|nr:hypothetical protein AAFF_G00154290 [Aldrovandia affinis]
MACEHEGRGREIMTKRSSLPEGRLRSQRGNVHVAVPTFTGREGNALPRFARSAAARGRRPTLRGTEPSNPSLRMEKPISAS